MIWLINPWPTLFWMKPATLSWPRSDRCRTLFSFYHFYFPCTTIQNLPEHSTILRSLLLWRILQTVLVWRSIFLELLGPSLWLHSCTSIYYRLYGIKYKYRVVAILYPSLVFVYSLIIPVSFSSSIQFELCALLWTIIHCTTDPLSSQSHIPLTLSSPEPSSSWHTPPLAAEPPQAL